MGMGAMQCNLYGCYPAVHWTSMLIWEAKCLRAPSWCTLCVRTAQQLDQGRLCIMSDSTEAGSREAPDHLPTASGCRTLTRRTCCVSNATCCVSDATCCSARRRAAL